MASRPSRMGATRKRGFSAAVEAAASVRQAELLEGCASPTGDGAAKGERKVAEPVEPEVAQEVSEAETWRRALVALAERALRRVDRQELLDLVDQDNTVPHRTRCELVEHGDRPVLVTAPHAIYVLRDGHTPHVMERHTSEIARAIAEELNCTSLQWTEEEQRRSKSLWDIADRAGVTEGALLDPRNRDPNYLSTDECVTNQWHKLMRRSAVGFLAAFGYGQAMLHIDVHGCRDPPETSSHLTIGLGAMLLQAEREGPAAVARVEAFGAALKAELSAEVYGLSFARLRPVPEPVSVLLPYGGDLSGSCARFSGAWPEETGRLTQSQQAVGLAGFTHSVQLEMSRSLRKALSDTKSARRFGNALRTAWAKAKRSGEGAGLVAG